MNISRALKQITLALGGDATKVVGYPVNRVVNYLSPLIVAFINDPNKNSSIATSKIKDNAITTNKIKDKNVTLDKLSDEVRGKLVNDYIVNFQESEGSLVSDKTYAQLVAAVENGCNIVLTKGSDRLFMSHFECGSGLKIEAISLSGTTASAWTCTLGIANNDELDSTYVTLTAVSE